MWRLVRLRLARSYTTLPTLRQWAEAALLLAAFAAAAVPLGLASGLLSFTPTGDSPGALLAFAVVAVVLPSLFEETFFRALLLPHPAEKLLRLRVAGQVTLAVALFVLWHPLSGWLFVPSARVLYYDGRFLGLCAVFGLVSSLVYLRTGSLWPSVAMHWVIIVGWKLWFGGSILVFGQP